jgi:hypothetical protein
MENTLEQLREKKRAYIKAEAQKIVDSMVRRGETTTKDETCPDAHYGWDAKRHASMPQICAELRTMGIASTSKVNFGVTDWVFTLIG